MRDEEVRDFLTNLDKQIRGGNDGMPPTKLSTDQLDNLLNLVRLGQITPNAYNHYKKNSSQSSNHAYDLSPVDIEEYKRMNPNTAEEAADLASGYLALNQEVPDHLMGKLYQFYKDHKLSQEDYERIFRNKGEGRNKNKMEQPQQNQNQQNQNQNQQPQQQTQAQAEQPQQNQQPFVQVNLGLVLKNLHSKAVEEVSKATNGRINITNSAYDAQTGNFITTPGVYSVRASSSRPLDSFGNWFRSKTARKALVMYLNSFLGPELAGRFKNASLYQPTTTNKNGDVISRKQGVFGRMKNWMTGKAYDQSEAGSKGAVKDVSNKVVSYWMKYKLVNGTSANESWIKFAMPGKPLVTESTEKPCESNGWIKLTVNRLTESRHPIRKSAAEKFIESALYEDERSAADSLRELVESKLAERFSEIDS